MRDSTNRGGDAMPRLTRLGDLPDYKVADSDPDVRGWQVRLGDREIGEVHDLVVDTDTMTARYLDVALDRKAFHLDRDRHVLVPVGRAHLHETEEVVFVDLANLTQVTALPEYDHESLSRAEEVALLRSVDEGYCAPDEGADFYGTPYYDERRFFGARRVARGTTTYVTGPTGTTGRPERAADVEVRRPVEKERVTRDTPDSGDRLAAGHGGDERSRGR